MTNLVFRVSFQPGDFIHTLGDAHVYVNHIEPLKVQVSHCGTEYHLFLLSHNRDIATFQQQHTLKEIKKEIWLTLNMCVHTHTHTRFCAVNGMHEHITHKIA